jgi:uncharacterized protein YqeY
MKISDQINEDLKDAMRAKDKITLEALRAAKTAFIIARTKEGAKGEITSEDELKIIQKLVKQRKESADIYKQSAREDLCQKEIDEAAALEKYLPAKLSIEEIKSVLIAIIARTGATGIKDMGNVMGIASKELAGKADGKEIAAAVKEILGV